MKLKKLALIFVTIYAILCVVIYIVVTIVPVAACVAGLVYLACTTGDSFLVTVSVFVVPAFLSLIASPFVREYLDLRKKHLPLDKPK